MIRYDARGHGRWAAPPGDYTIDDLGMDALAVLDAAGAPRAYVAGLSMGGQVAMWLGVHAADRVRGLVLANTAARFGGATSWNERIATVRAGGLAAVAEAGVANWFSAAFIEREPAVADRIRRMVARCSPVGYAGCCAALRDADLRDDLPRIAAPSLVIAGAVDTRTTVADAEYIRDRIPGATLVVLQASHLSNVEQPERFSDHLERFFTAHTDHAHA